MKVKKSYLKVLKILMCFGMMFSLICQNMTDVKAIATIYPYNPNAEIPGEYYNQYTGIQDRRDDYVITFQRHLKVSVILHQAA